MEKNTKFHIVINQKNGSNLKMQMPKTTKESDRLPEHVGTIFQSKDEVKEQFEVRKFKDFLK